MSASAAARLMTMVPARPEHRRAERSVPRPRLVARCGRFTRRPSMRRFRPRRSRGSGRAGAPAPARGDTRPPAEVGGALRTVYQTTINEDIPPEMLELLGKLG